MIVIKCLKCEKEYELGLISSSFSKCIFCGFKNPLDFDDNNDIIQLTMEEFRNKYCPHKTVVELINAEHD